MRHGAIAGLLALASVAAGDLGSPYTERVAKFWKWFEANANALREAIPKGKAPDWADRIADRVRALNSHLGWELRPGSKPGTEAFVLTGAGDRRLELLARRWKEAAPVIAGWDFHDHKPATVRRVIRFESGDYAATDFVVQVRPRSKEQRFDLRIHHPSFAKVSEKERYTVCFVWLDTVLGERNVEGRIAAVEPLLGIPKGPSRPMDKLASNLTDRMRELGWPPAPDPLTLHTMYATRPAKQESYAPREDLIAGWTVFRNYEDEVLSESGAAIVYLHFPNDRLTPGKQTFERGEIEAALENALAKDHLGYLVGGAHGVTRSYIEFLVFDLAKAEAAIAGAIKNETRVPSAELRGITTKHASTLK